MDTKSKLNRLSLSSKSDVLGLDSVYRLSNNSVNSKGSWTNQLDYHLDAMNVTNITTYQLINIRFC